ncbi:hypothetical protein K488DRAFT_56634 [Vararia minispora EC-137]|uniref:Uncharacterized protein n=1 Tax=Vararia minispora EC-137 TaxID=1314806 RepID=A0ACB8QBY4_9AGAM|nr:hypothetical protein K488DRAFT_56634 [Vararia minispora EC-137]
MDLRPIGAHCALPSCNELDLLPLTCFCDRQFCKRHIFPGTHDCPVDRSAISSSSASPPEKLRRCAFLKCPKISLEAYIAGVGDAATGRVPALCSRCRLAYCATHREPASHSCPTPEPSTKRKNEGAHAILAERFSPPTSSAPKPKAKALTDPKKLAALRKVEVMKMKHHAVPADRRDTATSIPLEQKLFVKVRAEGIRDDKVFWVRKSTGAGRALDLLSAQFNLSSTDAQPLQLSLADNPESVVLRNDVSLSEQVEDGSLLTISRLLTSGS